LAAAAVQLLYKRPETQAVSWLRSRLAAYIASDNRNIPLARLVSLILSLKRFSNHKKKQKQ
jgi:hypothetical protein